MASSTEQGDEVSLSSTSTANKSYFKADVVLRFLVFASTLSAIIVLVTSKQIVLAPRPFVAKFNHSPAFIYFLVALSVAGLYSLITLLASILVVFKPQYSTKCSLYLAFWDVLMLGLVSSATGTAGGVAYIGLKGNKHVQWMKICSIFDKFCKHIGSAIAVSLFASVILLVLVWLDLKALHKRIPK